VTPGLSLAWCVAFLLPTRLGEPGALVYLKSAMRILGFMKSLRLYAFSTLVGSAKEELKSIEKKLKEENP